MKSEELKSWKNLRTLDLRKRIDKLVQEKLVYDARMEGMFEIMSAVNPDNELRSTLIAIMNALKRIETSLFELTLNNLRMINALKEGLSASEHCLEKIENRLEKTETLDEMR